jgi:phosphatidylinositol-3-phosphatase
VLFVGMTGVKRFVQRHPRFQVALIGAVAIAGFSLLGGLGTAAPVSGPASASAASTRSPAVTEQLANLATSASPATRATSPASATPAASANPAANATKAKQPRTARTSTSLPKPAHIVIVLEENKSPQLLASHAPYIAALERRGANFSNAFAETHPSEPNYLALFSGSTHGIVDDSCPHTYAGGNLGAQILKSGRTFTGFAESLPHTGYAGCTSGTTYARKHTPWVNFPSVPVSDSLPFSQFPQGDFGSLPTVSFVTPNLCDDMHDCDVATGDAWLKTNLSRYATWAKTHNSLLIVTFDEAEGGVPNRIPLVIYGQPVVTGEYSQKVNHYSILRTIESMYGLPCLGNACDVKPMTAAFRAS